MLLKDEAYRRIRAAIVSCELAPGELIRDLDLADQLGLSRAPIRSALARLAEEGLVESKPQSWTRVSPLSAPAVHGACVVVRTLHGVAVGGAVPKLTDQHIRAMHDANRRFAAAVRAGDVEAAMAADDELHDVPVAVNGNRVLADTIERYTPLLHRHIWQRFSGLLAHGSIDRHEELIRACATRNAPGAVEITNQIWAVLEDQLTDEPGETR